MAKASRALGMLLEFENVSWGKKFREIGFKTQTEMFVAVLFIEGQTGNNFIQQ